MLSPMGATWKTIFTSISAHRLRDLDGFGGSLYLSFAISTTSGESELGLIPIARSLTHLMSQAAQVGLANKLVGMEDSVLSPNAIQTVLKTTRNYHKTPDDVRC